MSLSNGAPPCRPAFSTPAARARAVLVAALSLLLAIGSGFRPAGAEPYTIYDLGTLGGPLPHSISTPNAINASGQVVGIGYNRTGDPHAFLNDNTGMYDLGALGNSWNISQAYGINSSGQIVGYSQVNNGDTHAWLYSGGVMRDLGTLGGRHSTAHDINAAGHVVGYAQITHPHDPSLDGPVHAFLYDGNSMRDLGTLGGSDSHAYGINDTGQVVGWSYRSDGSLRGFLWEGGVLRDLGTLAGYTSSVAWAINASGQIVGWSYSSRNQVGVPSRAFLYDQDGMHDLGTLGGDYSRALGINNAGQVVGVSFTSQNTHETRRAFLYDGGTMVDLNPLLPSDSGWHLIEARAINDSGQIVGLGIRDGVYRGFLMTPGVAAPPVPPQAPTGLSIRPFSSNRFGDLVLTWVNADIHNQTGLEIERKKRGGDWAKIATIAPNSISYLDTSLQLYSRYTYRVRAVNSAGISPWSEEASADTGSAPIVSIAPGFLNFGSQRVGAPSAALTLTVLNEGTAPLTITRVNLAGDHTGEFAVREFSSTIPPGDRGSISLVFTPGALGGRSAQLTLATNASYSPTIPLSGTGTFPALSLSPTSLDFGQQPIGLNGTLVLLLQNTGTAPLTVGSITFQGPNAAEFTLAGGTPTSGTIQPGHISLLNIRFLPTETGSRSASLVITHDAADSPQLVPLTGTGTAPLLTLNAAALTFRIPSTGDAAAPQTLTFTNRGDAPLTVDGIALTGPDAGRFRIVSDSGERSLDPGASRTLQISFSSAAIASVSGPVRIAAARIATVSYNAALEIRHNDPRPDSPHHVALTAIPGGEDPASPEAPPAAPTGLTAQAASPGEIDLRWTDNSSNEQAFAIWRREGGSDWHRVGVVAPNTTSFADRGLAPGATYTYRVRATTGNLASPWTGEVSAATPAPRPAAPSNLTAATASSTATDLSWTIGRENETGVAIFRQTGTGEWQRIGVVSPGTTRYQDRSVSPGTSYTYRLRSHNATQVSAWSNEAGATVPPATPAAPSALTASVSGAGQITLTWTDGSTNETAFALWRRTEATSWVRIAVLVPDSTQYTDRGLDEETHYTYRLRAINNSGASAWSNEAGAIAALPPLGPPGDLRAVALTPTQVRLTWTDGSSRETGFSIWRREGEGDWVRWGVAAANATLFTDQSARAGITYTYRVRAHNNDAVSLWSREAPVELPLAR